MSILEPTPYVGCSGRSIVTFSDMAFSFFTTSKNDEKPPTVEAAMREEMQQMRMQMAADLQQMRGEMQSTMQQQLEHIRTEMVSDIRNQMNSEIQHSMQQMLQQMEQKIEQEVESRVQARMEVFRQDHQQQHKQQQLLQQQYEQLKQKLQQQTEKKEFSVREKAADSSQSTQAAVKALDDRVRELEHARVVQAVWNMERLEKELEQEVEQEDENTTSEWEMMTEHVATKIEALERNLEISVKRLWMETYDKHQRHERKFDHVHTVTEDLQQQIYQLAKQHTQQQEDVMAELDLLRKREEEREGKHELEGGDEFDFDAELERAKKELEKQGLRWSEVDWDAEEAAVDEKLRKFRDGEEEDQPVEECPVRARRESTATLADA